MENTNFLDGIIREIVKGDSRVYDVVYLHGDTGAVSELLGKLETDYCAARLDARVLRIAGKTFCEELIMAVQNGTFRHLISGYCGNDLLILEGIEAVSGKTFIMEQLYGIFDHFLEFGGQIVASGREPLAEMPGLEDRILAQLQGGICCAVYPASL